MNVSPSCRRSLVENRLTLRRFFPVTIENVKKIGTHERSDTKFVHTGVQEQMR